MNKNIKNILREKILRINLSKREIFIKVLKSINQNNNINNKIKIYTNYIHDKGLEKNSMQTKRHKICFFTGKRSGVLHGFSFSRYRIKKMIIENKLTNLKKHNW